MSWSAKQYVAFEDERTRPVRDLLSALPKLNVRRAADLGCGPGNSTEVLQRLFQDAHISGIDSSDDMIAAARKRLPRVEFVVTDVAQWHGNGPYDVILANAVFQWLPNHETLFPALISKLAIGGALAVQMPDNLDSPAHRLMRETAALSPWVHKLAKAAEARAALHDAEWYYRLLRPVTTRIELWRTTYYHALAGGAPAIVEWFKGSGLRPYLEPLDESERDAYLARYTAGISQAYPIFPDGSALLPFPRFFLVAIR